MYVTKLSNVSDQEIIQHPNMHKYINEDLFLSINSRFKSVKPELWLKEGGDDETKVSPVDIQNKNSPILSSTITNTKNASSNKSSLNSLPVTVIHPNEKLSKLHSSRPKLEFCIVISIWFIEHPSHTYFEKNKSFQILCYNIPFDIIEGVEEGK